MKVLIRYITAVVLVSIPFLFAMKSCFLFIPGVAISVATAFLLDKKGLWFDDPN